MQRLTRKLSPRSWKAVIIGGACLMISYCGWIMIVSFQQPWRNRMHIDTIRKPGYVTAPSIEEKLSPDAFSFAEKQRLELFIRYMDSLQASGAGKIRYDSIHHARPGLLDSVRKILHYASTNKFKP